MTPEEKAKNLILDFQPFIGDYRTGNKTSFENAKQCALIAVDEILDCLLKYKGMHDQEFFDADVFYFNEVREEINNL